MFFRRWANLLLLIVIIGGSSASMLSHTNQIEKIVKEERPLLVMYSATWCGYCAKAEESFRTACKDIDASISTIIISCDQDGMEGVCADTQDTGYPYIVMRVEGRQYSYNGEISASDIAAFAQSFLLPALVDDPTWSELRQSLNGRMPVVFFSIRAKEPMALSVEQMQMLAKDLRTEFLFYLLEGTSMSKSMGITKSSVALYQPADRKWYEPLTTESVDAVRTFIERYAFPAVAEYRRGMKQTFMRNHQAFGLLRYDGPDQKDAAFKLLNAVAENLKDRFPLLTLDAGNRSDLSRTDTDPDPNMQMFFEIMQTNTRRHYVLGEVKDGDTQLIAHFIDDFLNNLLQPTPRSQPPPVINMGPVPAIVASQLDRLIGSNVKVVLLVMYHPNALRFINFEPDLNTLGNEYAPNPQISIVKMDMDSNDLPPVCGAPVDADVALRLYTQGRVPIDYTGDFELRSIVRFLFTEGGVTDPIGDSTPEGCPCRVRERKQSVCSEGHAKITPKTDSLPSLDIDFAAGKKCSNCPQTNEDLKEISEAL